MPKNYDSIDLDLTWDGDYLTDETGDFQDTSYDLLQSIRNQITIRIKSALRDWREDPNIGADLDDFIGEPNNSDTAKQMEARIRGSLIDIVNPTDLTIRIIPVGVSRVLVSLRVQVLATPENQLKSGDIITIDFIYDYFEQGIFVPLDQLNHFGGRSI